MAGIFTLEASYRGRILGDEDGIGMWNVKSAWMLNVESAALQKQWSWDANLAFLWNVD